MESGEQQTEWLALSKAAERLNVHPTTLRRWADQGEIPVMLTPGGHRRFARADLVRFARERQNFRPVQDLGQLWADKAIIETRRELSKQSDISKQSDDNWLANFDDESRLRHRLLGQQLMGLTLRYLSEENGDSLLQQAREIGHEYATIALQASMPLAEALHAAMFFRDTLVETALHLPENVHVRPGANLRLLRRINTLLNTVHLAIAEEYDANYADSVSRS